MPKTCHSLSFRALCGFVRSWLILLVLFSGFRIGEARKPGPSENPSVPDRQWSIGVCNPSGLFGKQSVISSLAADVLAVSETHLISSARDPFLASLRGSGSKYRYLVSGAPVSPRFVGSEAGQYSGVALVSAFPSRPLCAPWPVDMFETARLQLVTSFVHDMWISGAICYGYPEGKLHARARERTEDLLSFAFERLCQASGPRYMGGDWNFEPDALRITQLLLDAGWREIQSLESDRTGAAPRVTCKGTSRKDMLWMSPELVQWFRGVDFDDCFPDHLVMTAFFSGPKRCIDRFVWPQPGFVPWNRVPDASAVVDFRSECPTKQYEHLWTSRETHAKQALGREWIPGMGGRASQIRPKKRTGWVAPIKQGRTTDFQPTFHGSNMQHVRWIRQLRRLHNFVQWSANRGTSDAHTLHGFALWQCILRAPGFAPSFQVWWKDRATCCLGDPPVVPNYLPNHDLALSLLGAFHSEVRRLESLLQMAKRQVKVENHKRDPNLIFKDVKRPSPEPVSSLLRSVQAQVSEVREEDSSFVLDRPVQFKADQPIWVQGTQMQPLISDHDQVWASDVSAVRPGDTVVQTTYLGSLPAVFQAFREQWQARWCRHDHLPHSHWQQILDFAARVLPCHPFPHLEVTPELVVAEAHRKKPRSATGLDGISRSDVLMACPQTLRSLVAMFERAETDGEWPQQVLCGRVASLAKTVNASTVSQYRPITVLSMCYRIWTSLQARYALHHADSWADAFAFGNRPRKRAAHMWWYILDAVEQARVADLPLTGLFCDIEKAFNSIPRWPVLVAALRLGVPDRLLTAWSGALAQITRHFKVRCSLSDGCRTSTGLAEGDALSCFGMLILDHMMHVWVSAQRPAVRCLSYVDDWSYLTLDPRVAESQLDYVLQFCELVDLKVDRNKTIAWSTDAQVRAALRQSGLATKPFTRELGAHLAFSRQFTNRVAQDRFVALEQFWNALRCSRAPYARKVFAIKAVGLPRCMYGISSVPLGDSVWVGLRRKASAALGMKKPGLNPLLLGWLENVDPQCAALFMTVRDCRDFVTLQVWEERVLPYALHMVDLPPNSPSRILVDRLHMIGLRIVSHGRVIDQFGKLDLLTGNFAEVSCRISLQWQFFVASELRHRPTFVGLEQVNLDAVRTALYGSSPDMAALLRRQLCGGFITENPRAHFEEQAGLCKWCGAQDSLYHRFWVCQQHSDLRRELAPTVAPLVDSLPPVRVLHGWAIQPPTSSAWTSMLAQLPQALPVPLISLQPGTWNHVFTDGSCYFQAVPSIRVAAWSACVAVPLETWHGEFPSCLASGFLPGIIQTAFRAELFALAYVLHVAAVSSCKVVVWTDCLSVVRRFNLLTKGLGRVKVNTANSDLWDWIQQSVQVLGSDAVEVRKVAAHKDVAQASSREEAWAWCNNGRADQFAKSANLTRPTGFWNLWQTHADEVWKFAKFFQEVGALHVAVAERSLRFDRSTTVDDQVAQAPKPIRVFELHCDLTAWTGEATPAFAREFGPAMTARLVAWLLQRCVQFDQQEVRWYPVAALYLDYQLTFGCAGPLKVGKVWVDRCQGRHLDAERFTFQSRLKWFKRCLKMLCTATGIDVRFETCRPHSDVILSFVQCCSVPWNPWTYHHCESWLRDHLVAPVIRDSKALHKLPLAKPLAAMKLQGFVQHG